MFAWRSLFTVIGSCIVLAAIGCGGTGNFGTVKGVVSHNGSPVDGAKVEFHGTTQEGGKSDIFVVQTDSSGKYFLASSGTNPGIPPGMYKVVITKLEGDVAMTGSQDGMDAGQMEAQMSDMAPGTAAMKTIKNLLPSEYGSLATSKLSTAVEAGKNENVNFDLK
jgi:hypothetical protein